MTLQPCCAALVDEDDREDCDELVDEADAADCNQAAERFCT